MKSIVAFFLLAASLEASELKFPVHGLTLALPDNVEWSTDKAFDNPEPRVSVRVYSAKERARQVQLMFGENSTPTKDLKEFARGWIRGMAKSGVVLVSEKEGRIDGISAVLFEVEVHNAEKSRRALAVVTLQGDRCYTFTLSSDFPDSSDDPVLTAIIASIKIRK